MRQQEEAAQSLIVTDYSINKNSSLVEKNQWAQPLDFDLIKPTQVPNESVNDLPNKLDYFMNTIMPKSIVNIQPNLNDINLSESHLSDLKEAIKKFTVPEIPELPIYNKNNNTELSKYLDGSMSPTSAKLLFSSGLLPATSLTDAKKISPAKKKSAISHSLAAISAKLPPSWKCKKNEKG